MIQRSPFGVASIMDILSVSGTLGALVGQEVLEHRCFNRRGYNSRIDSAPWGRLNGFTLISANCMGMSCKRTDMSILKHNFP